VCISKNLRVWSRSKSSKTGWAKKAFSDESEKGLFVCICLYLISFPQRMLSLHLCGASSPCRSTYRLQDLSQAWSPWRNPFLNLHSERVELHVRFFIFYPWLLNFSVNSIPLQDRVVLLEFQTIRRIFSVLLCHIAWSPRHTALFVLCALENDLVAIVFWFLSHRFGF